MIYGDQKDSDILQRYCDSLIGAIDAVGTPFEGRSTTVVQQTYLDLIRRIRCSLIGITVQLRYWPEHGELKIPISLLFRSCVTDILLLLYLKTLEQHTDTFQNELHLLDKPYVKFVASFINSGGLGNDQKEIKKQIDKLYTKAAHLLSATTPKVSFKNAATIRDTSDKDLLLLDEARLKGDLSTEAQYHHLANTADFKHLSDSFWLFKHFSQHEHYSSFGNHFVHLPQGFECVQWYKALLCCFETVRIVSTSLEASQELLEDLYLNAGPLIERLKDHQEDLAATSA